MAESHLACPDCETPVDSGRVQIAGFDRPVQCPGCGEVFMPWMLKVVRGLHTFLGGPLLEDSGVTFRTPYVFVPLSEAGSLQSRIDSLSSGGTIWLEAGTYTTAADLTMSNGNVTLMGVGWGTILTNAILIPSAFCTISDIMVRGAGRPYAIKIYNASDVTPRTTLRKVWMGASAQGAGNGPSGPGLWLDGAILSHVEQCTMAFNGTDGLYVNTSDTTPPINGTNVNTFHDCTFNINGGYGVNMEIGADGTAGMMGQQFFGGNMENNASGEFFASFCTLVHIKGVDFESAVANDRFIDIRASNPVIIEGCNFTGGGPTRMFVLDACEGAVFRFNRGDGFPAGAVGVFSDSCVQCEAYGNVCADSPGRIINNRGSLRSST